MENILPLPRIQITGAGYLLPLQTLKKQANLFNGEQTLEQ